VHGPNRRSRRQRAGAHLTVALALPGDCMASPGLTDSRRPVCRTAGLALPGVRPGIPTMPSAPHTRTDVGNTPTGVKRMNQPPPRRRQRHQAPRTALRAAGNNVVGSGKVTMPSAPHTRTDVGNTPTGVRCRQPALLAASPSTGRGPHEVGLPAAARRPSAPCKPCSTNPRRLTQGIPADTGRGSSHGGPRPARCLRGSGPGRGAGLGLGSTDLAGRGPPSGGPPPVVRGSDGQCHARTVAMMKLILFLSVFHESAG
jgi:hypothetical protein